MLKRILLLGLLLTSSVILSQSIEGQWQFESITKAGNSLFDINPEVDFMNLESGNFTYTLEAKNNLKASGSYQTVEDILSFQYLQPSDTLRHYAFRLIQDTLVLSEAGVDYRFIHKKSEKNTGTVTAAVKGAQDGDVNSALNENQEKIQATDGLSISLESLGRGLLGLVFLVLIGFLLSSNRRRIDWRLVRTGLLLQVIFAVLVLKVDLVAQSFDWLSQQVVTFLNFSEKGAEFLFGGLVNNQDTFGYIFAFKVLPTVVFFSAFTSVLYYFGIIQRVIKVFAWVMSRTMRLSGAESLAAAANIFIGQMLNVKSIGNHPKWGQNSKENSNPLWYLIILVN